MKPFSYLIFALFLCACANKKVQTKQPEAITKQSVVKQKEKAEKSEPAIEVSITDRGATFLSVEVPFGTAREKHHPAIEAMEYAAGKKSSFAPQLEVDSLILSHVNGLIYAIHISYDSHHPLHLSPDAIWLAICQQVSIHVNEKADSLRSVLFTHEGKQELRVRNDSLEYNEKHWVALIDSLANNTKEHMTKDYSNFFVPQFSTTTPHITTAYQITMLEAFKEAFVYIGDTGCGIPKITLGGTRQDWEWILKQITKLDALGLNEWRKELETVLAEFVNVFDNNVKPNFWNNIYKTAADYGGIFCSGWILKLFPYLISKQNTWIRIDTEREADVYKKSYCRNPYLKGSDYRLSKLTTRDFPSGLANITIIWNNLFTGTTHNMEAYSGFMGVIQREDLTIEPHISWMITDQNAEEVHKDGWTVVFPFSHYGKDIWAPYVSHDDEYLSLRAVYDPEQHENSLDSWETVKNLLLERMGNELEHADSIQFILLDNGEATQLAYFSTAERRNDKQYEPSTSPQEQKKAEAILKTINELPCKWRPAINKISNVFEHGDGVYQYIGNGKYEKTGNDAFIYVNSLITIRFITTDKSKS